MGELKALRDLVGELEGLPNKIGVKKSDYENSLREIGKKLLTDYEICLGDTIIEPLRVEAYCFIKEFEDKYIHHHKANGQTIYGPDQRGHFGGLYIHPGWSGVDLVLSQNEEYALSFLIKNSRIIDAKTRKTQREFEKQISLAENLKGKCSCREDWLNNNWIKKKHIANSSVVFRTVRKGLTEKDRKGFSHKEQAYFRTRRLAMVIELNGHSYDFETGFGKVDTIKDYLDHHKTISDRADFYKAHLGYTPSNIQ